MLSSLTKLGKKRKTIGRGGSRGGTSGKGHKGQKARSGGSVSAQFEGGQMPLTRRLPKRGFSNARFKTVYQVVSLERLENIFEAGSVVNKEVLLEKKIIKNGKKVLVKILGNNLLEKKLVVHADAFSKSAQEAILSKGGEVYITKEM